MTGGRIKNAFEFSGFNETFCLTYGDGLNNVDISASIDFHRKHGKRVTVTVVTPLGSFGIIEIQEGDELTWFREKIASDQYRIKGNFFVLEPSVKNYIIDETTVWEPGPLKDLARDGQLKVWIHDGFWHLMDTLCHKNTLNLSGKLEIHYG